MDRTCVAPGPSVRPEAIGDDQAAPVDGDAQAVAVGNSNTLKRRNST